MSTASNHHGIVKGTSAIAVGMTVVPPSSSAQRSSSQAQPPRTPARPEFPKGFHWPTISWQVEGSPDAYGKGKCFWNVYAHTPGKIKNGHVGNLAIKHYRRYQAIRVNMDRRSAGLALVWAFTFGDGRHNLLEVATLCGLELAAHRNAPNRHLGRGPLVESAPPVAP